MRTDCIAEGTPLKYCADLNGEEIQKRGEYLCVYLCKLTQGFPGGSVAKNLPVSARDSVPIPGTGGAPGEGMATHSSILAWETPWTEEPGRLSSARAPRVGHDLPTKQQQQKLRQHCKAIILQ